MMNKRHLIFCIGPLIAGALVSAHLILSARVPAAAGADTTGAFPTRPVPGSPQAKTAQSAPTSPPKATRFAHLPVAYRHSRDYRPFAQTFRQHPELGGIYYAAAATRECRAHGTGHDALRAPQPVIGGDSAPEQQVAQRLAFDLLRERCASFIDAELTAASVNSLYAETLARHDVLTLAARTFAHAGRSKDAAERISGVTAVLEHPDPLLIDTIGFGLSAGPLKGGGIAIWFDGTPYPVMSDPPIAAGFQLVPCKLGRVCDASDDSLAVPCAIDGTCYRDRYDHVRQVLSQGDETRYQEILRWTERIMAAIRERRADAFARRE